VQQEDAEGFTIWELSANQDRRAIHVEDLEGFFAVLNGLLSVRACMRVSGW
jgi:hypothetical protein